MDSDFHDSVLLHDICMWLCDQVRDRHEPVSSLLGSLEPSILLTVLSHVVPSMPNEPPLHLLHGDSEMLLMVYINCCRRFGLTHTFHLFDHPIVGNGNGNTAAILRNIAELRAITLAKDSGDESPIIPPFCESLNVDAPSNSARIDPFQPELVVATVPKSPSIVPLSYREHCALYTGSLHSDAKEESLERLWLWLLTNEPVEISQLSLRDTMSIAATRRISEARAAYIGTSLDSSDLALVLSHNLNAPGVGTMLVRRKLIRELLRIGVPSHLRGLIWSFLLQSRTPTLNRTINETFVDVSDPIAGLKVKCESLLSLYCSSGFHPTELSPIAGPSMEPRTSCSDDMCYHIPLLRHASSYTLLLLSNSHYLDESEYPHTLAPFFSSESVNGFSKICPFLLDFVRKSIPSTAGVHAQQLHLDLKRSAVSLPCVEASRVSFHVIPDSFTSDSSKSPPFSSSDHYPAASSGADLKNNNLINPFFDVGDRFRSRLVVHGMLCSYSESLLSSSLYGDSPVLDTLEPEFSSYFDDVENALFYASNSECSSISRQRAYLRSSFLDSTTAGQFCIRIKQCGTHTLSTSSNSGSSSSSYSNLRQFLGDPSHRLNLGVPEVTVSLSSLKRILLAVATLVPRIGFCQGLPLVILPILEHMSESMAFPVVVSLLTNTLHPSHFTDFSFPMFMGNVFSESVLTVYPEIVHHISCVSSGLPAPAIQWNWLHKKGSAVSSSRHEKSTEKDGSINSPSKYLHGSIIDGSVSSSDVNAHSAATPRKHAQTVTSSLPQEKSSSSLGSDMNIPNFTHFFGANPVSYRPVSLPPVQFRVDPKNALDYLSAATLRWFGCLFPTPFSSSFRHHAFEMRLSEGPKADLRAALALLALARPLILRCKDMSSVMDLMEWLPSWTHSSAVNAVLNGSRDLSLAIASATSLSENSLFNSQNSNGSAGAGHAVSFATTNTETSREFVVSPRHGIISRPILPRLGLSVKQSAFAASSRSSMFSSGIFEFADYFGGDAKIAALASAGIEADNPFSSTSDDFLGSSRDGIHVVNPLRSDNAVSSTLDSSIPEKKLKLLLPLSLVQLFHPSSPLQLQLALSLNGGVQSLTSAELRQLSAVSVTLSSSNSSSINSSSSISTHSVSYTPHGGSLSNSVSAEARGKYGASAFTMAGLLPSSTPLIRHLGLLRNANIPPSHGISSQSLHSLLFGTASFVSVALNSPGYTQFIRSCSKTSPFRPCNLNDNSNSAAFIAREGHSSSVRAKSPKPSHVASLEAFHQPRERRGKLITPSSNGELVDPVVQLYSRILSNIFSSPATESADFRKFIVLMKVAGTLAFEQSNFDSISLDSIEKGIEVQMEISKRSGSVETVTESTASTAVPLNPIEPLSQENLKLKYTMSSLSLKNGNGIDLPNDQNHSDVEVDEGAEADADDTAHHPCDHEVENDEDHSHEANEEDSSSDVLSPADISFNAHLVDSSSATSAQKHHNGGLVLDIDSPTSHPVSFHHVVEEREVSQERPVTPVSISHDPVKYSPSVSSGSTVVTSRNNSRNGISSSNIQSAVNSNNNSVGQVGSNHGITSNVLPLLLPVPPVLSSPHASRPPPSITSGPYFSLITSMKIHISSSYAANRIAHMRNIWIEETMDTLMEDVRDIISRHGGTSSHSSRSLSPDNISSTVELAEPLDLSFACEEEIRRRLLAVPVSIRVPLPLAPAPLFPLCPLALSRNREDLGNGLVPACACACGRARYQWLTKIATRLQSFPVSTNVLAGSVPLKTLVLLETWPGDSAFTSEFLASSLFRSVVSRQSGTFPDGFPPTKYHSWGQPGSNWLILPEFHEVRFDRSLFQTPAPRWLMDAIHGASGDRVPSFTAPSLPPIGPLGRQVSALSGSVNGARLATSAPSSSVLGEDSLSRQSRGSTASSFSANSLQEKGYLLGSSRDEVDSGSLPPPDGVSRGISTLSSMSSGLPPPPESLNSSLRLLALLYADFRLIEGYWRSESFGFASALQSVVVPRTDLKSTHASVGVTHITMLNAPPATLGDTPPLSNLSPSHADSNSSTLTRLPAPNGSVAVREISVPISALPRTLVLPGGGEVEDSVSYWHQGGSDPFIFGQKGGVNSTRSNRFPNPPSEKKSISGFLHSLGSSRKEKAKAYEYERSSNVLELNCNSDSFNSLALPQAIFGSNVFPKYFFQ